MITLKEYINESQDKYFTEEEKGKILKDMWNKDGAFYKFLKDKVNSLLAVDINNYFDQCLNDDRCLAELAEYISLIINRYNFSLKQVKYFVEHEDLKG